MNIADIKASISRQLGITIGTLDIHQQKNEDGSIEPNWVSAWIEQPRARISMHKEIFAKIVADRSFTGLAVKAPVVITPVGKDSYQRFVIITPESILASF